MPNAPCFLSCPDEKVAILVDTGCHRRLGGDGDRGDFCKGFCGYRGCGNGGGVSLTTWSKVVWKSSTTAPL